MGVKDAPIWRGAHAAIWLAFFGSIIAFVWEMLQLPFYDTGDLSPPEVVYRCGLAAVGDSGIMVAAYSAAAIGSAEGPWLIAMSRYRIAGYLAVGLSITAAIEHFAIGSDWGWTYSPAMPLLAGTEIGLVPVLMWIIVPVVALWLTRRTGFREC